ncbi:MAG TPA: NHL repeat-containing protein [Thermoanaerobaculia bacterium]
MLLRTAVAVALALAAPLFAQPLKIQTLAGSTSGGGHIDAQGESARFSAPRAIAVDAAGNFYVADTGNHVIRKITPDGEVSTLAGAPGVAGYADGTGSAARFRFPTGIAVDAGSGAIFVSDKDNHVIRRVTIDGVVTTFAGTGGIQGTTNGTGSAARFTFPRGIAFDTLGNLMVADTGNHVIRKINRSAVVTTHAGAMRSSGSSDGFGAQAGLNSPFEVALDPTTASLLVSDTGNHTIRKVTPDGRVTTVAGSPLASGDEDGTGSEARFAAPWGIAVDSAGYAYVTDSANQKIRWVSPAGEVTTFAGDGFAGTVDGLSTLARFTYPSDVVLGPDGALYVADAYTMSIRRIPIAAAFVSTFAGSKPANGTDAGSNAAGTNARFHFPHGIAVDGAGNAYVAESSGAIRRITPEGVVSVFAGAQGTSGSADGPALSARFSFPRGLAFDPNGNLFVADTNNHTIRKITPAGIVTTFAGVAGEFGFQNGTGAQARFYYPWDVATDSLGNVYVTDAYNHSIRIIEPAGVVTTFAGSGGAGYFDAIGTSADFRYPLGISIDTARNLYIADWGNDVIRRITQAGVVTTLAGSATEAGSTDGIGPAARFLAPEDVVSDADGNLYVSDENHLIRRVTNTGLVTTVAGLAGSPGNVNGVGGQARFTWPEGLALTASGELLIADTYDHAIRIGTVIAPKRRAARH